MLALFPRLVRWLRFDGVRALRDMNYRAVVAVHPHPDCDGSEVWDLACGHRVRINPVRRASIPCEECTDLQRANAEESQPTKNSPAEPQPLK